MKTTDTAVAAFTPDYTPDPSSRTPIEAKSGASGRKQQSETTICAARHVTVALTMQLSRDIRADIAELNREADALRATLPADWADQRKQYVALSTAAKKARFQYRRTVDEAYEPVAETDSDRSGVPMRWLPSATS